MKPLYVCVPLVAGGPRRSIALLDFDGNMVTMEMSSGMVRRVAEGVESVVDLTVRGRRQGRVFLRCRYRPVEGQPTADPERVLCVKV